MGVIKKLVLFYVLFVIVKTILSYFIASPTMFDDALIYSKLARNFFYNFTLNYLGKPYKYPPIYPSILSISYFFRNMVNIYTVMKIINVLCSSLVIFPAYLIARDFFSKRKSILVAILVSVLPINFAYSSYILSENLFYPISLFTIYFVYKSFKKPTFFWAVFAGFFLGLSYLTKVLAVGLIPPIIVLLIYKIIKKEFIHIKNKIILFGVAFLMIFPLLIRNVLNWGFSLKGLTGYVDEIVGLESRFSFLSFFYWILLYLTYILLAFVIILFISSLFVKKRKKTFLFKLLTLSLFGTYLLLVSMHSSLYPHGESWLIGRPLGRYFAVSFSSIIILGCIGIKENFIRKFSYKKIFLIGLLLSIILLSGLKLISFSLFPSNNTSLGYIGLFSFLLDTLDINKYIIIGLIFFLIPTILLFIYKKYNFTFKKTLFLFSIFFLIVSLLCYSINYYNAEQWGKLDQLQMGKWINEQDLEGKIMFDFNRVVFGENVREKVYIGSFWVNKEVEMGKSLDKFDYFVTKQELPLPLIKKIGNVYLYKNDFKTY